MSRAHTLYLPHHHMGLPMSGTDTMYLLITRRDPRCPTQTCCTYPITGRPPMSSPNTLYLPNQQMGHLISGPDTQYLPHH